MTDNGNKEILAQRPTSSTHIMKTEDTLPAKKSSFSGSDVAPNSKVIEKAGSKGKSYMGARRSCAWVHVSPKMDYPKKCNSTRSNNIGDLKILIIESMEALRRHTVDNKELRSKCLRPENELEFANRRLFQLH